jgi:hypothetical protein
MSKEIPAHLQGILWSADVGKLDMERDRNYIVHQVLMYGDLPDIKWLLKIYSPGTVRSVFINSPKKVYTKPIFRLVKNFFLALKETDLDERKYVRAVF